MRAPRLLILLAAALAALPALPAASAAPWPLEFSSPAQADGRVEAQGLEWALLVFPPAGGGEVAWELDAAGSVADHTAAKLAAQGPATAIVPTRSATQRSDAPDQAGTTSFAGGWGSLYVEARSIRLQSGPTSGRLEEVQAGDAAERHLYGTPAPLGTFRPDGGRAVAAGASWAVGGLDAPAEVAFSAEGLVRAEWHNATTACARDGPCPVGGGASEPAPTSPAAGGARLIVLDYGEVAAGSGRLSGSGRVLGWAAGGPSPSLAVDGAVRLPLATQAGPCAACADPANRTVQAEGRLTLDGLRPAGRSGRLAATMDGAVAAGRLDEQPLRGAAVAAAAAAVGIPLLAGLLYALRHLLPLRLAGRRPDVLDHPRRRRLHALVVQEPGLTFRDILRRTGLGSGTAHHHLDALLRAGLVVAKREGNRLRHFENHGRHEATWRASSALRDARVAALHAWLLARPGASRQDVLRQAGEWGWKPGITDHRLRRLVASGLASMQRRGREQWFVALAVAMPAGPPAPVARAAVTAG